MWLVSPEAGTDPALAGSERPGMRDLLKALGGAGLGAWLLVGVWLRLHAPDMCSKIGNVPSASLGRGGALHRAASPLVC